MHKELQDTMAQLEAIRHEIRSISFMNPGPLTTRLVDNIASHPPVINGIYFVKTFVFYSSRPYLFLTFSFVTGL